MGRKRHFMEDDDSSDPSEAGEDNDWRPDEDPDARAERALFENPYQRKRRKRTDDEDDEEEGFGGKKGVGRKRTDWTKAPAFVSSGPQKTNDVKISSDSDESGSENEADADVGEELDGGDEEFDEGEDVDMDEDMEDERAPSPREKPPSDDEKVPPARQGLGARSFASAFSTAGAPAPAPSPASFPGTSRGGIGSARGGIGAKPSSAAPLPTAFGASAATSNGDRAQRSFLRNQAGPAAVAMTPAEKRHFDSLSGSFGAKLMAKMGWEKGTGLGVEGKGIVTPIETKMRPQKAGIAFRGFKEKTEQSKVEARRRGEKVSDDEEKPAKGRKKDVKDRSDMWKKPAKKTKTKVEHKTYEDLIRDAGGDTAAVPGLGVIIDATGAVPREVSSLSELPTASWTPSTDPMRLPEVRHNLRVIVDMAKGDLDGLAREGKALGERDKFLAAEGKRLGGIISAEAELIARLQKIRIVVDEIAVQAKEIASTYEPSLDSFEKSFETLLDQYPADYEKFGLDEVVVGAITPTVRRMVASWDPLADPTAFSPSFHRWKRAFRMSQTRPPDGQMELYERRGKKAKEEESSSVMTPYDSLMWNVWLPRVRSSINNSWSPEDADPAILLYTTWSPLLPEFISANILDQLILPKLSAAVADWNVKKPVPLHTLVFPWLPYLGLRSDELLSEAKRKVKNVLKNWAVDDGVWTQLGSWREILPTAEWDNLLLKYIVPKLSASLREDFKVNPRNQKMDALDNVLLWKDFIRPSVMAQILEAEFFPKWLETLHFWLVQPKTSFEDVAQWYSFWKAYLPASIVKLAPVEQGFNRGLQLMNKAMELGPKAAHQLPRPESLLPSKTASMGVSNRNGVGKPAKPSAPTVEVTFRSIVEDFVAAHNLLFIPTGQAHEKSRMPMFRVSPSVDGKGGISVYLMDDAVWAQEGADFKAISLEEMVLRANRAVARHR